MKLSDWGIVGAGLLLVVALQFDFVSSRQITRYAAEQTVETYGPHPTEKSPETYAAYLEFTDTAGYFGAFATAANDNYGWSDNFTRQDHADAAALAFCGGIAAGCRIIARLRPAAESRLGDRQLSHTQARALEEFQAARGQKAIAMSDEGDWGAAYQRDFRQQAEQAALENCRKQLLSNPPPGVPVGECVLITVP